MSGAPATRPMNERLSMDEEKHGEVSQAMRVACLGASGGGRVSGTPRELGRP